MKYTENDIKVGTKLRCTKGTPSWWTVGKVYDVTLNEEYGDLNITDDDGSPALSSYILDCLNENHNPVAFEIVEEEKEITKYVEVTKLIDWSSDPELLEVGKVYKVAEEYKDMLYAKGVSIYVNEEHQSYYLRSDQFKFIDQKEEEKEMKKYAKITKYFGRFNTDKRCGLEIGKEYEIVSYDSSLNDHCRIYLNEEHPSYFISENQYELVEKEVPTLKANVNVDVKEVIQAKIEQLRTDAEIIANKRNRMEWQMFNLNSKANKLEEVIETIKEFE